MDLPSLAVVLQAALSPNPAERKAAEQSLNQVLLFFFFLLLLIGFDYLFLYQKIEFFGFCLVAVSVYASASGETVTDHS